MTTFNCDTLLRFTSHPLRLHDGWAPSNADVLYRV